MSCGCKTSPSANPKAEKDTIHNLNLTVRPGEKLAIVGLNGAGKTTLVKLLCGLLDPTEGAVLLDGQDIRQFNRRDYYALFSAVFQEFSVLAATVAENVSQAVEGGDQDKVRACLDKAGLTEKIDSLPKGIDTQVGREVYEDGVLFSGGQTQRGRCCCSTSRRRRSTRLQRTTSTSNTTR